MPSFHEAKLALSDNCCDRPPPTTAGMGFRLGEIEDYRDGLRHKDQSLAAVASKKIQDPVKFTNNLQKNVDKFIQKTMKNFPPKK